MSGSKYEVQLEDSVTPFFPAQVDVQDEASSDIT